MDQASLPLHQHEPRGVAQGTELFHALEHELLRSAGDEIGRHRVHRDAPSFDEDPRLPRGDEAGAVAAAHQRVSQLELRRHLAHVAVAADREDDIGIDLSGAAVGDRQGRGRLARVEDADAARPGEAPQLGVVSEEGMEAAPDLETLRDRALQPAAPLDGQLATRGGDPDQDRRGAAGDAALEFVHHRNRAAEAQHLLRGLARVGAVQDRDDALGEVADARIRRLRREGAELPVGDDEKAVLGGAHQAVVWVLGMRNSPLERSTAASASVPSP